MATTSSQPRQSGPAGPVPTRRDRVRSRTVEEALDHAVEIMAADGVGALSVSEVARRMGMRGPSLYKYFDSLHAVYDALFARGLAASDHAVRTAIAAHPPGVEAIRAGMRANVRWCVENPALAQLLYWRVVPGFEPDPETFEASRRQVRDVRLLFAEAARRGELAPEADSDEAVRLLSVLISGLVTQQMANQPGAPYDEGLFSSLTDKALDVFLRHYGHQPTKGRS